MSELWNFWDNEIDRKYDNLPENCPNCDLPLNSYNILETKKQLRLCRKCDYHYYSLLESSEWEV